MKSGGFNFGQLVDSLVEEENKKRNRIIPDGWGIEEAWSGEPIPITVRRKKRWLAPTLITAGLVAGVTTAGAVSLRRHPLPARVPVRDPAFATVSVATGGRGAQDPVVESAHLGSGPVVEDAHLPPATAARRALERQRPVPDGRPASTAQAEDGEAVSPEALLALADQKKEPAAERRAPAPSASAPAEPAPKTPAPAAPAAAASAPVKPAAAVPAASDAPAAVPAAATTEDTPSEGLSRAAIHRGFASVREQVVACRERAPADATMVSVTAVVSPDGSLDEIEVEGPVGQSAAAPCVLAAVRRAHFASFRGPSQTVHYPFRLQ